MLVALYYKVMFLFGARGGIEYPMSSDGIYPIRINAHSVNSKRFGAKEYR